MSRADEHYSKLPDKFDRLLGALHGLPDVVSTKPTTIRTLVPLLGTAEAYIVQTYRQGDKGCTVFIEIVTADGSIRQAIPPKVIETMLRQFDSLGRKVRSDAAKATAADRKRRGELPGFLRKKEPAA